MSNSFEIASEVIVLGKIAFVGNMRFVLLVQIPTKQEKKTLRCIYFVSCAVPLGSAGINKRYQCRCNMDGSVYGGVLVHLSLLTALEARIITRTPSMGRATAEAPVASNKILH